MVEPHARPGARRATVAIAALTLSCLGASCDSSEGSDPATTTTPTAAGLTVQLAFADADDAQRFSELLPDLLELDAEVAVDAATAAVRFPTVGRSDVELVLDNFEPAELRIGPTTACIVGEELGTGAENVVVARDGERCDVPASIAAPVDLAAATAVVQAGGQWAMMLGLETEGPDRERLDEMFAHCFDRADECPNGRLAMFVEDELLLAAAVQAPTFGDEVQITGTFTELELRLLAWRINSASGGLDYEVVSYAYVD